MLSRVGPELGLGNGISRGRRRAARDRDRRGLGLLANSRPRVCSCLILVACVVRGVWRVNGDHACCVQGAGCRAHGADRCAGAREFYCVLSVECCVRESSSLALFTQATRLVLVLALVVVVVGGGV